MIIRSFPSKDLWFFVKGILRAKVGIYETGLLVCPNLLFFFILLFLFFLLVIVGTASRLKSDCPSSPTPSTLRVRPVKNLLRLTRLSDKSWTAPAPRNRPGPEMVFNSMLPRAVCRHSADGLSTEVHRFRVQRGELPHILFRERSITSHKGLIMLPFNLRDA